MRFARGPGAGCPASRPAASGPASCQWPSRGSARCRGVLPGVACTRRLERVLGTGGGLEGIACKVTRGLLVKSLACCRPAMNTAPPEDPTRGAGSSSCAARRRTCDTRLEYGVRDAACPVSTGGGTRRVQSIREGGGAAARLERARPAAPQRARRRSADSEAVYNSRYCAGREFRAEAGLWRWHLERRVVDRRPVLCLRRRPLRREEPVPPRCGTKQLTTPQLTTPQLTTPQLTTPHHTTPQPRAPQHRQGPPRGQQAPARRGVARVVRRRPGAGCGSGRASVRQQEPPPPPPLVPSGHAASLTPY